MIWLSAAVVVLVAGFGVACLLSVRAACLAALTMLREYLASDLRGEIIHLRAQIAAKDEQILAITHPTTQAVLKNQAAPKVPYDDKWQAAASRPRNPTQWDVSIPGDGS